MRWSRLLTGVFGVSAALAIAGMAHARGEDHDKDKHGKDTRLQQQGLSRSVKLSNTGTKPLEDIKIGFTGKDAVAFHQTNDCGEKLAGKASCTINVWFAPKTRGPKTATMEIHTSGGGQSVPLSGPGV